MKNILTTIIIYWRTPDKNLPFCQQEPKKTISKSFKNFSNKKYQNWLSDALNEFQEVDRLILKNELEFRVEIYFDFLNYDFQEWELKPLFCKTFSHLKNLGYTIEKFETALRKE